MSGSSVSLPADVFAVSCPSRLVLSRLAGKWPLLVIDALGGGAMRNGALLRRITGVSQKMLTETLRELEELDLVERTVLDKVPPHVEYRLTPLGESLSSVVAQLDRWVEQHLHLMGAGGMVGVHEQSRVDLLDPRVQICGANGDVAVVTFTLLVTYPAQGTGVPAFYSDNQTRVLVREGGDTWKMHHFHRSPTHS